MIRRTISVIVLAALAAFAGLAGFRLLRSGVTAEVYRSRLEVLADDYASLRERYDTAVRRTAVTELLVRDGRLSVTVRTAEGVQQTIPTPYDPSREVYIDYVVVDGRLWIRRVFGEDTPPREGIVVDPRLAHVDWNAPGASHGKAAYRALEEGRWVVTVTGDGSLGLAPADGEPIELSPPPPVQRFEPVEGEVDDALRRIGPAEVLHVFARELTGERTAPAARPAAGSP
jgi:hypothetical protein